MAWKKDLEKLKKTMDPEAPPPPKAPVRPKPAESRPLEEEDAVFLSAMGHRPRPSGPGPLPAATPPARASAPPAAPAEAEFAAAMGDLKGVVTLRSQEPGAARTTQQGAPGGPSAPKPAPQAVAAPAPPEPRPEAGPEAKAPLAPPPPAKEAHAPSPATEPAQPVQINLAAGMAIDVDGTLDLKGHSRSDAEERLKERILDGHALGWRSLQVILGPSEELRSMLLELVKGVSAPHIARYAQAPIPMGGTQAWILYFRAQAPDVP